MIGRTMTMRASQYGVCDWGRPINRPSQSGGHTNNTYKAIELDYEYNDPSDRTASPRAATITATPQRASRRVLLHGTHPDYYGAGDHPTRSVSEALAISQMVYQSGFNAANSGGTLTRDNKGPGGERVQRPIEATTAGEICKTGLGRELAFWVVSFFRPEIA
jgi:hypothetical protein